MPHPSSTIFDTKDIASHHLNLIPSGAFYIRCQNNCGEVVILAYAEQVKTLLRAVLKEYIVWNTRVRVVYLQMEHTF